MTEEQIAKLKADRAEDGDTGERLVLVRPADLRRVLEERKRLLEALREMLPVAEGASFERMVTGRADHAIRIEQRRENALAAVAYAEGAAP